MCCLISSRPLTIAATFVMLAGCTEAPEGIDLALLHQNRANAEGHESSEPIRPLPPLPQVDSGKAALGKLLFNDPRLSADNSISCASCHALDIGGADGRPTGVGVGGAIGPINVPTVLNAVHNFAQFWDGRVDSLEAQVPGPIHNPIEMASNWQEVLRKLTADRAMVEKFRHLYRTNPNPGAIVDAIATYERTLVTPDGSFDRYLRGDHSAISATAKAGYELFKSIGCASCHQGRNVGGNMYQRFGIMGDYFRDRGEMTSADYGRFNVTGLASDRFRFKVPSLRNISRTAPYFHDGSIPTLDAAVKLMAQYQLGEELTPIQVVQIVSFLETLDGPIPQ